LAEDDAKVAEIALPLVRCRREKGLGDRVADRLGDLTRRRARLVIKDDKRERDGLGTAQQSDSAITGESAPVLKEPGTDMFSSFSALELQRTHRCQPKTQNARVWGANLCGSI
jgi:hypothetical protein